MGLSPIYDILSVCKGGYGGEGAPIGGYAPMPEGAHVDNLYPTPPHC